MARGRAGSRSRGGELASVGFNDLRKPPLGEKRRHSSTPLVAIAADAACLSLTARTNRRAADDRVSGELKSGGSRSAGTHSLAETVRPAREMSRLGDHRRGPRLGRLCHGFQVQAEAPPTGRRSAKSASPLVPLLHGRPLHRHLTTLPPRPSLFLDARKPAKTFTLRRDPPLGNSEREREESGGGGPPRTHGTSEIQSAKLVSV